MSKNCKFCYFKVIFILSDLIKIKKASTCLDMMKFYFCCGNIFRKPKKVNTSEPNNLKWPRSQKIAIKTTSNVLEELKLFFLWKYWIYIFWKIKFYRITDSLFFWKKWPFGLPKIIKYNWLKILDYVNVWYEKPLRNFAL